MSEFYIKSICKIIMVGINILRNNFDDRTDKLADVPTKDRPFEHIKETLKPTLFSEYLHQRLIYLRVYCKRESMVSGVFLRS
ncbi:hypothetical protein HZS_7267 [Henneguya salminicola]|nr:hypothetical protein HZS_7267 [Henneguya salminicola]